MNEQQLDKLLTNAMLALEGVCYILFIIFLGWLWNVA